jgi:hypothetical protein
MGTIHRTDTYEDVSETVINMYVLFATDLFMNRFCITEVLGLSKTLNFVRKSSTG